MAWIQSTLNDNSLKIAHSYSVPRQKVTFISLFTHLRLADVTAWELLRGVTWDNGWQKPPSSVADWLLRANHWRFLSTVKSWLVNGDAPAEQDNARPFGAEPRGQQWLVSLLKEVCFDWMFWLADEKACWQIERDFDSTKFCIHLLLHIQIKNIIVLLLLVGFL